MWIWSIKVIKAGEEITIDYGKDYFDDFIKPVGCKCAKCAYFSPTKTKLYQGFYIFNSLDFSLLRLTHFLGQK